MCVCVFVFTFVLVFMFEKKCQDRKLECGIDDWERERAGRGLPKTEHRNPMCAGN